MKRFFSVCIAVMVASAVFATAGASAQEPARRHELRLSVGVLPHWSGDRFEYNPVNTRYKGPTYTSGVWTLSYGYRIKRWFEVGGAISYSGDFASVYSNFDDSKLYADNVHDISVMPVVRFTWLNRKYIRLYSSLGAGVMFETGNRLRGTSLYLSGQLVPVGLAVGGSLFGFAEVGVGTQGFALVGIGYRFNDKKQTK